MQHADVQPGSVHTPFNWLFASDTDRLAASGFAAGDVSKVAVDLDTGEQWRVSAVDGGGAATWQRIGFPPANVITTPVGAAEQDLLVRSGGTWARLAVGAAGQQLIVRSDGTLQYTEPAAIHIRAWGADPSFTSTTNRIAIQNAINQAAGGSGAAGGEIRYAHGSYTVDRALLVYYGTRHIGSGGQNTTTLNVDATKTIADYQNGTRLPQYAAIMKWDGGDAWCHGVEIKNIKFNPTAIPGVMATAFEAAGELSDFHNLQCVATTSVNRTVADAQITGGNTTVPFTASTFTIDDVNALVTDRVDGDHTLAGPTIPAWTKIDRVAFADPRTSATATTIVLSRPPTGAAANSSFTIKRPTPGFLWDSTNAGHARGRVGSLNGNDITGPMVWLKNYYGVFSFDSLSGDNNIGGHLRITRAGAGIDPTAIRVGQLKCENNVYDSNYPCAMDPVVLLDGCATIALDINHGLFATAGGRDIIRIDQPYLNDGGGPSIHLSGVEGANWFNTQYTNIIRDSSTGEAIQSSPYGPTPAFPEIFWNRRVLLGGGARIPDTEKWAPRGGNYMTRPFYNNCTATLLLQNFYAAPYVYYNATTALQDSMTWLEDLEPGTYDLMVLGVAKNDAPIVTVEIGTGVVPTPAAPSGLASVAGTGPAAGTYSVQYSYATANGETVAGPSTSITVDGTHSLSIPSPNQFPANAPQNNPITGWYAYVTQAGGGTSFRQQAAGVPTALGTSLVLTATPTNTGATPVTNDTSGTWTAVGTWDLYNASTVGVTATKQFTGFVVPAHHGPCRMRYRVTGRNASNTTAYTMQIAGRVWQRTA